MTTGALIALAAVTVVACVAAGYAALAWWFLSTYPDPTRNRVAHDVTFGVFFAVLVLGPLVAAALWGPAWLLLYIPIALIVGL